ncbi:MAG: tetratricopeptide repeat protein, partial [Gammaproteobacteria bacterium]|nr:tetratricopeptide repeat protein [Gammaproteobacteria bacterium]
EAPSEQGPDYMRFAVWVIVMVVVIGAGAYYLWLQQQAGAVSEIKPVKANVQQQPQIAEPVSTEMQAPVAVENEISSMSAVVEEKPEIAVPVEKRQGDKKPARSSTVAYLPLKDDGEPAIASLAAPKKPQNAQSVVKKTKPVKPVPNKQPSEILIVKSTKTGIALVKELLETGRLTEAEKNLGDILRKTPNSLPAHELLTGLLLRNNRLDEAKKQLGTARKFYPNNENLVLLQSRVLIEEGRVDDVIGLLEALQSKDKAGIRSTAMLASLYQQKGNFAESLKLYNTLAKAAPANAGYWMGLAVSLDALNDPQKAKKAYLKALQTGGLSLSLGNYARQRIGLINQQNNGKQ